jgi:photosystem II stability/assembly factor-like uncharacterized protein
MVTTFTALGSDLWVVKGQRTIIASRDAGATWAVAAADVGANVRAMSFSSPSVGWIATDLGLMRTSDGGGTWVADGSFSDATFVQFIDAGDGWARADGGVERTTDAGATWTRAADVCGFMSFATRDIGWSLCPIDKAAGTEWRKLYRTDDGGLSWALFSFAPLDQTPSPYQLAEAGYATDLFFLDERHGWISGARLSLSSTADGAHTWTKRLSSISGDGDDATARVQFTSVTHGYVLLTRPPHALLETDDAGATWRQVYPK